MVFDEDRTPTWFLMICEPLDPILLDPILMFGPSTTPEMSGSCLPLVPSEAGVRCKPLGWQQSYGGQGFLSSK